MIERPPSGNRGRFFFFCNLSRSRSYTGCSSYAKATEDGQSQTPNERNRPMNKNINNAVELTEKELACVCGGGDTIIMPGRRAIVRETGGVIREKKLNQAVVF